MGTLSANGCDVTLGATSSTIVGSPPSLAGPSQPHEEWTSPVSATTPPAAPTPRTSSASRSSRVAVPLIRVHGPRAVDHEPGAPHGVGETFDWARAAPAGGASPGWRGTPTACGWRGAAAPGRTPADRRRASIGPRCRSPRRRCGAGGRDPRCGCRARRARPVGPRSTARHRRRRPSSPTEVRPGSHSSWARPAATSRSSHGPSRPSSWPAAPPRQAFAATSWSSHTATIGWAAWSAWRSGSVRCCA